MNEKFNYIIKCLNKRLVQFQEKIIRNQYVLGYPFYIVLETGNICNLKCQLCPTPNREREIPKGFLSFENAKRIIDKIPTIVTINYSFWGEPFLNKDIFKILSYAKNKGIKSYIQTNFNYVTDEILNNIVDVGIDPLQVSLDGVSQDTYQKYRVKGDFNKVINNIKRLRKFQKERNNFSTKLCWQFIVNKYNEHELEKAREFSKGLGMDFKVVEIYVPSLYKKDWKPKEKLSNQEDAGYKVNRNLCDSLWQNMVVNFNGDVFPCCSEYSPSDSIGNILDQPVSKIWNNKRYRMLRKANKNNMNCSICHVNKDTNWQKFSRGDLLPGRNSS